MQSKFDHKIEKHEIKFNTNSPNNSILFAFWHDRSVVRLMSNINMTEIVIQKITKMSSQKLKKNLY